MKMNFLFTLGNGTSDADRSNAMTIYKDGKTNLMGRYASTTFNYKITRRLGWPPFIPYFYRDYVYGVYSLINRDDPSIEYYYSGYFTSSGESGTYRGLYADLFSSPTVNATDLNVSNLATMPAVYSTAVGATRRVLYIDDTGKLGYLSSSIRYKKDIEELSDVSWLYNLKPITYRYKDSYSVEKEIGLIAEDVLEVNPNFVSFNNEGNPETVNYSALITPLLKAIQDQKKTIESLKTDNDDLKQRLDELEKVVKLFTRE